MRTAAPANVRRLLLLGFANMVVCHDALANARSSCQTTAEAGLGSGEDSSFRDGDDDVSLEPEIRMTFNTN